MKAIIYLLMTGLILLFSSFNALEAQTKRPKTVHLKSYTTKKGKHVTSYKRSTPRRHK